jgi:hypothetical protein
MLYVDAAGIGAREIADQLLEWRRSFFEQLE